MFPKDNLTSLVLAQQITGEAKFNLFTQFNILKGRCILVAQNASTVPYIYCLLREEIHLFIY